MSVLSDIGGEAGCRALSKDFYAMVATSPELKPLFPGKSLRCASEEFAAFLIQFLGGDEKQTQYRWWLSLRESHARFKVSEGQREAWLKLMSEALESRSGNQEILQFFQAVAGYVAGSLEAVEIENPELAECWRDQLRLDSLTESIRTQRDEEAILLADTFLHRPSLSVGILARMLETRRPALVDYAAARVLDHPDLRQAAFNGRPLLHHAVGSGCLRVVQCLLAQGCDANQLDDMGHAPLYRAASCKDSEEGIKVVRALVDCGGDVNHQGGISRATALHQAARFGNLPVASALIQLGANLSLKDKKGATPLDRARTGRNRELGRFLWGA